MGNFPNVRTVGGQRALHGDSYHVLNRIVDLNVNRGNHGHFLDRILLIGHAFSCCGLFIVVLQAGR